MLKSSSQKKAHDEQLHLKSESSYTPLHQAAIAGDDAAVEVLLVSGASRFAADNKHGNTPLHECAWRGYSRCVKLLCTLQQTQRSNGGKKFGKKTKCVKHVEDEWKNQTYLNTANAGGFSPLHLAAQNGHNQSCREILLAGANPDVKNNYGDTPLHTSCRYGHAGATRILLSAKCDPMSVNLNYDTPLHIACAMGRRKLTRILYEMCGSNGLLLRNAQGETARDIAIRKNLKPIIEILNSTVPNIAVKCTGDDVMDGRRSRKHRSDSGSGQNYTSDASDKLKPKHCVNNKKPHDPNSTNNPKIWSPYGCQTHYFPDSRTFPPPKLETFPKDPLKMGEQYYCDLAGNIRKGPVGIGNACYCGPFFNHIEQKINQNKKCFKKYVIKASGKHDAKGHDEKIHRIARSIMAEHRHKHGFDYWPKRSDPLRATVVPQLSKCKKDEMNNNTLSRCRSLEFLDERKSIDGKKMDPHMNRGNLHRSFDLLNNVEQHEVIVHHHHTKQSDAMSSKYNSIHQPSTNTSESGQKSSSYKQYALDFREKHGNATTTHSTRSDVESLEDFTNQSMEIIQMKRAARQRFKERTMNELRERQKAMDNSFLKFPPNFSSTLTAASIDDLRDYHTSNHYPTDIITDFDDISVEMKNITKLLSASIIEPLESAPSTSSSFYHSTDKLAKRFTLYNEGNAADEDDDGGESTSDLERDATNSCQSVKLPTASGATLTTNGFFQNKSFGQNQSSSSCDTLKSIELPKTNGNGMANNNTNGHNDDDTIGDEEDDDDGSGSDNDLDNLPTAATAAAQRISFAQHVPRTGLVSARIKSLLAKNLQTSNKMPTVRSSLITNSTNSSTFKSSKHLRAPLKSCDPMKSPLNSNKMTKIHAVSHTASTNNCVHELDTEKTGDSSEDEAEITVHKATVHANQIQTDSNDERTKLES